MKKTLCAIALAIFTNLHIQADAAPQPPTKADLNAKITKQKNNITMFQEMLKAFANDPETVSSFNNQIAQARTNITTLQTQLKTAK